MHRNLETFVWRITDLSLAVGTEGVDLELGSLIVPEECDPNVAFYRDSSDRPPFEKSINKKTFLEP